MISTSFEGARTKPEFPCGTQGSGDISSWKPGGIPHK